MPDSSQHQSNFLGGEWSKFMLGRSDMPEYRTALERCVNAIPVEEGAWLRRTGTERLGPAYLRGTQSPSAPGALKPFQSSAGCAFACEFTYQALRFWSGTQLIFTNDARTVSAASFAGGAISLTLDANSGWSVGDQVQFDFNGISGVNPSLEGGCRGRTFNVTGGGGASTALTLKDDLGNSLTLPAWPGSTLVGAKVYRILRFSTIYQSNFDKIRIVQAETQGIILWPFGVPYLLTVTEPTGNNDPTFTLGALNFVDGPYLDPQGTTLNHEGGTVSATSGSITFTPATTVPPTDGSDNGRLIRLFTEPAAWNSGTSYSAGTNVKYNGQYWQAVNTGPYASSNTNVPPGSLYYASSGNAAVFWVPAIQAASWAYGVITGAASGHYNVTLTTALNSANGTTISQWALGVYKIGQYPTCGVFVEGRLMLAGAFQNHFDLSMPYDPLVTTTVTYSPSDQYGNVFDNHAISETLNAKDLNSINWLESDKEGILAGTQSGEWLISASELSDPLTPTSIQAKQVTKYGSFLSEPKRCGLALVFIHRYGRRLYEFLADAFSAKYSGKPLNERAKHMSTNGFVEMAYQEENNPIVWVRDAVGAWIGCTYRRVSRFVTENPVFFGWHRHAHGSSGKVVSMMVAPGENGVSDVLYMMVQEPTTQHVFVEVMTPLPDPVIDQ